MKKWKKYNFASDDQSWHKYNFIKHTHGQDIQILKIISKESDRFYIKYNEGDDSTSIRVNHNGAFWIFVLESLDDLQKGTI